MNTYGTTNASALHVRRYSMQGETVRFVHVRMGDVHRDEGILIKRDGPWLTLRLGDDEIVVIHTNQVRNVSDLHL